VKLSFQRHAELAKTDTLFIHGNLASSRWWNPALEQWKKAARGPASLLMADWRGCGENPDWNHDQAFTLTDLAQDYLELLDQEKIAKLNIVGHSLGGLIVLQMMTMQPHRFNQAFLLDPVGAQGVVFDDSMYEAFRQMAASPDLTRTVVLSTVLGAERLEPVLQEQIATDAYKAVRGIGTSVLEILKTVDLREKAQHVKVPTLIAHGQQDAIIPLKDSEALSKLLPNAQLEVLPQVGHCWNVENPRDFTKRVQAWFQEG
jgi:pimeloyl-ACP methyl ester carboxylesterase